MALDMEIKGLLLESLEGLGQEDFKRFKFNTDLPESVTEDADRTDIAKQLAKMHGKNAGEKTIEILEKINNYNLAQKLRNDLPHITGSISSVDNEQISKFKLELQENLRQIYLNVPEGNTEDGRQEPLENVYTELNITRGVAGLPNKQHEVLQMEMCGVAEEESIQPCDIFQSQKPLRTMLTVGFAGIGKTFLVRKFVLDWASGETNTDVDFIFPFAFRELNLEEGKSFSLAELIRLFVLESEAIEMLDHILVSLQESANRHYQSSEIKILFVLDGLDESRLKLDLSNQRKERLDVTQAYPVEVLLAHLIKGNLLPCARVWITTRPQAAHDIPPRLVDGRTEVKGFSDSQRLDYFRKRFPGEEDLIKHIQKSRTILIMCHLPIFCWITATILQDCRDAGKELPQTLTEMYTEFLLYHLDKSKERDSQKSTEYVKALAKLAFQQLMKKQQIFYESDLRESGLDDLQGAKHSGVFTVVFKEVPPLKKYQRKMFQFIHLTVQEYLAALYVMMSLFQDDTNVLDDSGWTRKGLLLFWKRKQLTSVHEVAIRIASKSEGNLDLFLRFLLGLSLQCNQDLLGELLKVPKNYRHSKSETVRLIKERIERNSPEENINLFYCLKELKDESLLEQIQQYLKGGKFSTEDLPPAMWSALVFFLRASDEAMSCFELGKYARSEKGLLMLLPVVKASQKSVLRDCQLSKKSCEALASVLSSSHTLRELDLCFNELCDDGLEALAAGLAKPQCTLQVLGLFCCKLSKKSCEALASVLSSPGNLRLLNLSFNELRDDGLEALAAGLAKPECTLQVLGLQSCKLSKKSCEALASVLSSSRTLRELVLNENDLHDDGLEALAAGLAKPQCTLQVLKLWNCKLSKKSCEALASVLSSSHTLRELNLGYNDLHDHGLEALAAGLAKPECTLQVLGLFCCKLSKKSCEALASVLSSPGNLRLLNLSFNELRDDGLEALAAGLAKPECTLQVLGLEKCWLSKKSCEALASVLSSSRTLSHLVLNENDLHDDGLEALAAGLAKPQCTLQVLKLQDCKLSKKSCEALASVLSSSHTLRELDLCFNELCDDGLEALAAGLAKPQCTLQDLRLEDCKLSKKSCEALFSVLSSPGCLKELNLGSNALHDDGLKALAAGLAKPQCTLQVLGLESCNLSKESCEALASVLSSPGSLRELDLSENDLYDDGLEALAAGLAKPQCTLQVLGLESCNLSEKSCEALASILSSPGTLRELYLSNNDLCDDGLEALAAGLANPECTLEVLELEGCNLSKESCEALASVLSSPGSLRELDLSENELCDDGLEALAAGLAKPQCTLQVLGLVECEIGTQGCVSLAKALRSNPSHLQQLKLWGNDISEEGKRALEEVQMDSRCSLKIEWVDY
ncbi:NACHT, LRR and PYD domains-containing protein 3-like isoform 2-T2 [Syngnathus typhle]